MSAPVVDYVPSWAARLQSRLYKQFKNDPSWNLWCTDILGPQFQDLEDAAQGLLALLNIAEAVGAQLDLIGRLVGQPRAGLDDDTYRFYLQARIAANRSDGGPRSIYRVFGLLFPGQHLTLAYSPIRTFTLTIDGAITDAQQIAALTFLGDTKSGGVRGILVTQAAPDSEMFTFGKTATLRTSVAAGAVTTLVLAWTNATWPKTGSVHLDNGSGTIETLAYSALVAGTMTVSGTLANSYPIGSAVELVGDPGLGWGDATDPTVGGEFENAAEAA